MKQNVDKSKTNTLEWKETDRRKKGTREGTRIRDLVSHTCGSLMNTPNWKP